MSAPSEPKRPGDARRKGPIELRRNQAKGSTSDARLLDTRTAGEFTSTDPWRVLRIQSEFVEGFGALANVGPAVSVFGSARTRSGHCRSMRPGWKWAGGWRRPT